MTTALRLLTAVPLVIMAAVLLVLGLQRSGAPQPAPAHAHGRDLGALLIEAERYDDAVDWYRALARDGDPVSLRRLAEAADLAERPADRAAALTQLVMGTGATFAEHLDAAALLAAAGATSDALRILYNAEQRFPSAADERFLSFFAALALDGGRPDVALPLARRLSQGAASDHTRRLLQQLTQAAGNRS